MTATISSYNEELSRDYFLVASHDLDLEDPELFDARIQGFALLGVNFDIREYYAKNDSLKDLEIPGLSSKTMGLLEVILMEGSVHGAIKWLSERENSYLNGYQPRNYGKSKTRMPEDFYTSDSMKIALEKASSRTD